jgi:hypothetical protein
MPIIIGFCGEDDANLRDEAIRASLRAIFDLLDHRYPHTRKILLTALNSRADALAAEDVVARDGWDVVCALALPLDLHLQRLGTAEATQARALIEAARRPQRIRLLALAPLRETREPQSCDSGAPARGPESHDRADNDEQAALFIARHCAVLIAITPAHDETQRSGGTGRAVQYRLHGERDSTARDLMRRSRVLPETPLLDAPDSGPVWLVDSARTDRKGRPPVKVLLPADTTVAPGRRLKESLRLPDRLHEFNQRALRLPEETLREAPDADRGAAAALLGRFMLALSSIQIEANRKFKWSVLALAVLFRVALFTFEVQTDLSKSWGVFGYVGALTMGIAIYKVASACRWQPLAQDYRAVAEALRVQIAWWNCGLVGPRERVDRFYLRGTIGSLGQVRAAVRHMINAALLASDDCDVAPAWKTGAEKWSYDSDKRCEIVAMRWIDEQISYFDRKLDRRRSWVSFIDASSWYLLTASLGPEVLYAVNAVAGDVVRPVFAKVFVLRPPGCVLAGSVVALVLIFLVGAAPWLLFSAASADRTDRTFATPGSAISVIAGLVLAAGLYDGAALFRSDGASDVLFLLGGFSIASIAYAMQFISSQLSWSPEMRGYEDALLIFQRARASLRELDHPDVRPHDRTRLRHAIIQALGEEALKENESWLRAHRERPLEPLPPT